MIAIIDELAATDTYDLDEEDDKWIRTHNTSSKSRALSEEQVEKVITKLEQLANEKKVSLSWAFFVLYSPLL